MTTMAGDLGRRVKAAALYYFAWAALGFAFGLHIVVLLAKQPRGERRALWLHLLSVWIAFALFAGLGAFCRFRGSTPCPGGEDMSRDCLRDTQVNPYRGAYVVHFIALGFVVARWAWDGVQGWSWATAQSCGRPMPLLFSRVRFESGAHGALLVLLTILVTLVWAVAVPWNSSDQGSLSLLGGVEVGVVLGTMALGAVALRLVPSGAAAAAAAGSGEHKVRDDGRSGEERDDSE